MDSVIIPTHDRRHLVLRLLSALARQRVEPGAFEVIVVVDGASDGTAEALRSEHWPFPLRVVEQPRWSGSRPQSRRGGRDRRVLRLPG